MIMMAWAGNDGEARHADDNARIGRRERGGAGQSNDGSASKEQGSHLNETPVMWLPTTTGNLAWGSCNNQAANQGHSMAIACYN
jgi:hypothetical protein